MYKNTEFRILEQLYTNPGMHRGELSRRLKLTGPAIDNGLKKIKKLLEKVKSGNQIHYQLNFKKRELSAGLAVVEQRRIERLPYRIRLAVESFLQQLSEKPLIAFIFGSYASQTYSDDSDIDLLLVYDQLKNTHDIEQKARHLGSSHNTTISPIYTTFEEFKKSINDRRNLFYKELRESKIILVGVEWWRYIESEQA